MQSKVVSIHIASKKEAPLVSVPEVEAVAGRGLRGDRYYDAGGTFSRGGNAPDRHVTLIEAETIDALGRDYKVQIDPGQARRNIVTRGVALNHLVGREFVVGPVRLRGIKLCEPCGHLARLTSEQTSSGLVHRGGLRSQILSDGIIHVGDEVKITGD